MRRQYVLLAIGIVVLGGLARAGVRAWRLADARRAAAGWGATPPRTVEIRPDYSGMVMPPNIAPLNFVVLSAGTRYYVEVAGSGGGELSVLSSNPTIRLPLGRWRGLLERARSGEVRITIRIRDDRGEWQSFTPMTSRVAEEPIDPYLSYREIPPVYNLWGRIRIHQRHLETFEDRPILDNHLVGDDCVNCHAYRQGHTDRMTIGTRGKTCGSSTFLAVDGQPLKVGAKLGYAAWHPSGLVVAYSENQVFQFFHTAGTEVRDVIDSDSDLAYLDLRSRKIRTTPAIADANRLETYPAWSPDGRYLYFSSAPITWKDRSVIPFARYREVRYDLRRASYDVNADRWGPPETVLSAKATGKSILLPRVSPDGRWLLFCMCDYGCFPAYQPTSDLYMMDLATGKYNRLPINSDRSESWHSWSSNSRWIAFSSKRQDGLLTRTYLSYVERDGTVRKPFVVPQKDPRFYDSYLYTWSVPELHVEPVPLGSPQIADTLTGALDISAKSPIVLGNRGPGARPSSPASAPWQQAR
jgi:hypothetical protein